MYGDLVTKSVYIGFFFLYAYINLDHQYKSTLRYSFMTSSLLFRLNSEFVYSPLNMDPHTCRRWCCLHA